MGLVNVASVCATAGFPLRVDDFDAANSFLMDKLGNSPPSCGMRMPFLGPDYMNAAQLNTVRDWIDEGALDN